MANDAPRATHFFFLESVHLLVLVHSLLGVVGAAPDQL